MLKKNWKYVVFFIAVFTAIVAVQLNAPEPVNWNKTYLPKDKIPFGCSAFYDVLDQSAFKNRLVKIRSNIYQTLDSSKVLPSASSTVFINDNLRFDDVETKLLLNYVVNGNKVLLAASTFDGLLADTLNIKTNIEFSYFDPMAKDSDNVFVLNPSLPKRKLFTYKQGVPPVHFISVDTAKAMVIAEDAKKHPVFISYKLGKGIIYVMSSPEVFTNFALVKRPARDYAYTAISYINMPEVRFDEYYKTFNPHISSELQFIFANDSLYAAYGVAILSIFLFMVFNMRRRQRAVPIITPPSNSTLEFVEVVGNVYFNAKNHKVIAEEKINFFLEYIRSKFQVNTQLLTEESFRRITALSGLERKEIDGLFNLIEKIQFARNISEVQLIELNTLIEQFQLKNKR